MSRMTVRWDYTGAFCLTLVCALQMSPASLGQCSGEVLSHGKISDTEGGFGGVLNDTDAFGLAVTLLGNLDDAAAPDLAVASPFFDDGGQDRGGVWILFLDLDGSVIREQKISDTQGEFPGILNDNDRFGFSVTSLGDFDGDGNEDLAVGATGDDDGGFNRGAVWILFLEADGTVKSYRKISDTEGGFTGTLENLDVFGNSVAFLGDVDGDGIGDLAVGASNDSDDGPNRGAMWILFLEADGTVKAHQKINDLEGNFECVLHDTDHFGYSTAALGDLDGDGRKELAVGAFGADARAGAVFVLFLDAGGNVKRCQKISSTEGGFTGVLDPDDNFGISVTSLGDIDGDGNGDLAVGAKRDDDGGTGTNVNTGAVWILTLHADGTVKSHQKISATEGNFVGQLETTDHFGAALASLGDFNDDGVTDLAVGAALDDDGGTNRGAVCMLYLNAPLRLELGSASLAWGPAAGAVAYDLVRGDLGWLRDSAGDFTAASEECLAGNRAETWFDYSVPPGPTQGFWFLVRRSFETTNGSYEMCGPSQSGSRDPEISNSGVDCP